MGNRGYVTDGKRSVYLHSSENENTLKILKNFYNTSEKVRNLLDMGGMSMLGKSLGPAWSGFKMSDLNNQALNKRFFGEDDSAYCVFYHRDRGDELEIIPKGMTRKNACEGGVFIFNEQTGWLMVYPNGTTTENKHIFAKRVAEIDNIEKTLTQTGLYHVLSFARSHPGSRIFGYTFDKKLTYRYCGLTIAKNKTEAIKKASADRYDKGLLQMEEWTPNGKDTPEKVLSDMEKFERGESVSQKLTALLSEALDVYDDPNVREAGVISYHLDSNLLVVKCLPKGFSMLANTVGGLSVAANRKHKVIVQSSIGAGVSQSTPHRRTQKPVEATNVYAVRRVFNKEKKFIGLTLSNGIQYENFSLDKCIDKAQNNEIKNVKAVTRSGKTHLQGNGIALESLPCIVV